MAKTYNTFTNVSGGSVLTASNYNDVLENIGNYRVPPMFVGSFAQSANDSANQDITLTEIDDTDAMFTSGTTITVTTAGLYLITCYGTWSGGTAPTRADVWATHSVSGQLDRDIRLMSSVEGNRISFTHKMADAETIKFSVFQDNAANTARTFTGRASMVWLGQVS